MTNMNRRNHKIILSLTHTERPKNDNNIEENEICVRECSTQILFCQTLEFSIRFFFSGTHNQTKKKEFGALLCHVLHTFPLHTVEYRAYTCGT